MDHSELGEPHNGFRFKFLEPTEYEQALQFMEDHLYDCLIPVGYEKKFKEDWNNIFRAMMENGSNLSYIAVHIESGEMAACRMVDLVIKDKPHDLPSIKHKMNEDILFLNEEICKNENLFEKYGITQYADMFGLCVNPKFREMSCFRNVQKGTRPFEGQGF